MFRPFSHDSLDWNITLYKTFKRRYYNTCLCHVGIYGDAIYFFVVVRSAIIDNDKHAIHDIFFSRKLAYNVVEVTKLKDLSLIIFQKCL